MDERTVQRLENWGDWVCSTWATRSRGPGRCPGLEGQYRAPVDKTEAEALARRNPWRETIDPLDAAKVNAVIESPMFPAKERAFLRAWYVVGLHERQAVKALGILRLHFDVWLARSVGVMRNRLTVADAAVYRRSHNLTAASCVTEPCETSQGSASEKQEHPALAA